MKKSLLKPFLKHGDDLLGQNLKALYIILKSLLLNKLPKLHINIVKILLIDRLIKEDIFLHNKDIQMMHQQNQLIKPPLIM